ncbi:MAG: DUF4105 domain-containing protein [Phycisphaeraceae bacterium]|nr:DUF4105 domain-containing protein [Phycisphaeraceae bacterium]
MLWTILSGTLSACVIAAWALLGLWATLAVYFCCPFRAWITLGLAAAVAGLFAGSLRERKRERRVPRLGTRDSWKQRRFRLLAAGAAAIVASWYLGFVKPDPTLEWAPEHSRMPHVDVEGDLVRISNVRNFLWRSRTDFTPGFYDRTYDAGKIASMYYVVVPMNSFDGVAHVMLCFAFSDGQAVTISVEGRREKNRPYAILPSMFRQFQLIYVIGDERDVVGVRGAIWKNPVRMYPARATPDRMRAIFLDMVARAHKLEEEPEFYHLILNNCMNNITAHLRRLGGRPLPSDLAVLLTGLSDRVAYRFGYFDTELPFEKARRAFRVDQWMQTTPLDEGFSARLRETLVRQERELRDSD